MVIFVVNEEDKILHSLNDKHVVHLPRAGDYISCKKMKARGRKKYTKIKDINVDKKVEGTVIAVKHYYTDWKDVKNASIRIVINEGS
jgi:hypothetical protein